MVFRKVKNLDYLNQQYVHPLNQKNVYELVEHLKQKKEVQKIIVFGSSVTAKCHNGSDVDFYAELTEDVKPITKYFDFNFDMWTNYTTNRKMLDEINKTGVTVYEK